MVEKGIRGGICHNNHRHAIANNSYMKDYSKNKESFYLRYWDVNNFYGWSLSQKLPVNDFNWVGDISELNEEFIKATYFLEVDVQYSENLLNVYNDLPFLPVRMN